MFRPGSPCAMWPPALKDLARRVATARAAGARAAAPRAAASGPSYTVESGVAVIQIVGPMIKGSDSLLDALSIAYTNTLATARAVADAARDGAAGSILLCIDSGGGMVAGLDDLTDAVAAAAHAKPTLAHVSDWGASGAYEVAACTAFVSANAGAGVGSIGVCAAVWDDSERFNKAGVTVHLVSSGGVKGQGVYAGVPVSAEYIADLQRQVDGLTEQFIVRVARGRGLRVADVRELATGEMWLASAAKSRGLIDHVGSGDAALARAAVAADGGVGGRYVERIDVAFTPRVPEAGEAGGVGRAHPRRSARTGRRRRPRGAGARGGGAGGFCARRRPGNADGHGRRAARRGIRRGALPGQGRHAAADAAPGLCRRLRRDAEGFGTGRHNGGDRAGGPAAVAGVLRKRRQPARAARQAPRPPGGARRTARPARHQGHA